jgi:hypothetical protein
MRFEFYSEGLRDVPKLAVDGTVENAVHFSHWQGNRTDPVVKADTSTEIALNVAASAERERLTRGIELVTNNHFDTDGVLSVWTMLEGVRALEYREKLIGAAEAGDFSEFPSMEAVCASIVIQGSDYAIPEEGVGSPLAIARNGGGPVDEARAYELILPEVERVISDVNGYEQFWHGEWVRIEAWLNSFESGASRVVEHPETGLSVVTLEGNLFGQSAFTPTRHIAPYTAIAHNARGSLFLIAAPMGSGWSYRIDYPYYSWAETVVRPRVVRRDLSGLVEELNELERESSGQQKPTGQWIVDGTELSSAVKFRDEEGSLAVSTLDPARLTSALDQAIRLIDCCGDTSG